MRPDQDPILTKMGIGTNTCNKCMTELYPNTDDSICDNCNLNAIKKGDATQYIKEVMDHEASFPNTELKQQNAALSTSTTRAKHLSWCKKRALEYVEKGDVINAYSSMISDLRKHPETNNHPAIELGVMLMMSGNLTSSDEMKNFIDGFS